MEYSGYILYVLLVAILVLCKRKAPALNLDKLLKHDEHIHHKVISAIAKHPHGATWKEFSKDLEQPKP